MRLPALRYLGLSVWATPWFMWAYMQSRGELKDWYTFVYGGRVLLGAMPGHHAAAIHLYADNAAIQIGPPPLLLSGVIALLGGRNSDLVAGTVIVLLGLVTMWCVELTARALAAHECRELQKRIWLGSAVLMVPWAYSAGSFVHLDDAMALTAAAAAVAVLVRRGSWTVVAGCLGFAAACKPWAIVLFPLLYVLEMHRTKAVLLAFVVAVGWWVPFVIGDPGTVAALGGFAVPVDPHSAVHSLGLATGSSPKWLRPLGLYVSTAAALVCAFSGRWALAPAMGLVLRVGLDPQALSYYALGPLLGALLLDAAIGSRWWPQWTLTVAGLMYAAPLVAGSEAAAVRLMGLVTLLALVGVTAWRIGRISLRPAGDLRTIG